MNNLIQSIKELENDAYTFLKTNVGEYWHLLSKDLETMYNFNSELKIYHYMGKEMNIQRWSLLEKEDRDDDVVRRVNFSKVSLYHKKYFETNLKAEPWFGCE